MFYYEDVLLDERYGALYSLTVGVVPCLTGKALKFNYVGFSFELCLKCLLKYSNAASEFNLEAAKLS